MNEALKVGCTADELTEHLRSYEIPDEPHCLREGDRTRNPLRQVVDVPPCRKLGACLLERMGDE